jgi:hypothetical protein
VEIASRFPQLHPSDYGELLLILKIEKDLPGLLAKFEMAKWSNPALSRTCYRNQAQSSRLRQYPGRERAYSIECPECFCSTEAGYICADHTAFVTFRLQPSGGPYIR